MNEFSQLVTEMKEWPKYCLRNTAGKYGDGLGCAIISYANITSYLDIEGGNN